MKTYEIDIDKVPWTLVLPPERYVVIARNGLLVATAEVENGRLVRLDRTGSPLRGLTDPREAEALTALEKLLTADTP